MSKRMWIWVKQEGDDSATTCRYDPQSRKIDLGDELFMYAETVVQARGWSHDVDIHVGLLDGRLVAERLDVRRHETSTAITSEVLRGIPVAAAVRYAAGAVRYVHERHDSGGMTVGMAWPSEEEGEYVARHGFDDETLKIVARIYRVAFLIGDAPTKKVETLLNLPRSTAGRWVAAARERGYLSESRGAGKAGG